VPKVRACHIDLDAERIKRKQAFFDIDLENAPPSVRLADIIRP